MRVLLAVESGSRAWGFASPDSDYDIRFLYVHPDDWYVSVFEPRDVIEALRPGDLDFSGWDLRKALRLFFKCNIALNEWLGSPVVYLDCGLREPLGALLPRFFNPVAALHHCRSLAARTLEEHLAGGRIGIKKLFYVLRPLLACRWIVTRASPPPTPFAELLAAGLATSEEETWIDALHTRKATAVESDPVEVAPSRAASLQAELESYRSAVPPPAPSPRPAAHELDRLLRRWASACGG